MLFYLGTHKPVWLTRTDVPLFVSRRTLAEYKTPPKARGIWALDSGGFSELQLYGRWQTSAADYAAEARRYQQEVGNLQWAAIQDWMCEPLIINGGKAGRLVFKGTKLSVKEHQKRTIESWYALANLAPSVPWVPVLQGWHADEYVDHFYQWQDAGVDLELLPLVGVGSVCRRQATEEALDILRELNKRSCQMNLHGFGFKIDGLWAGAAYLLASADSMAWSKAARHEPPMLGHTHKTCANCMPFALDWREKVLAAVTRGETNYQTVLL